MEPVANDPFQKMVTTEAPCAVLLPACLKVRGALPILDFSDKADLDDGVLWPSSFVIAKPGVADKTGGGALVKQAVN